MLWDGAATRLLQKTASLLLAEQLDEVTFCVNSNQSIKFIIDNGFVLKHKI